MIDPQVAKHRKPDYDINEVFLNRWSSRAMSGEGISDDELFSLMEAARWAPSSFNGQPWRFIYAKREDKQAWDGLFSCLVEFNQQWAKNASALILIISRKAFEGSEKPAPTYQFDAGAAWQNLALEATWRGLVVHAMEGFNKDKARQDLGIPEVYDPIAIVAIGKKGKPDDLPDELKDKEVVNTRKPLSELSMKGRFSENK